MTIEERVAKYKAAVEKVEEETGISMRAVIQWEGLPGQLVATGATIRLVAIDDWIPPEAESD